MPPFSFRRGDGQSGLSQHGKFGVRLRIRRDQHLSPLMVLRSKKEGARHVRSVLLCQIIVVTAAVAE